MAQCGPEWQMLQVHCIIVLSDLINWKEWAQWLGRAMAAFMPFLVDEAVRHILKTEQQGESLAAGLRQGKTLSFLAEISDREDQKWLQLL